MMETLPEIVPTATMSCDPRRIAASTADQPRAASANRIIAGGRRYRALEADVLDCENRRTTQEYRGAQLLSQHRDRHRHGGDQGYGCNGNSIVTI
jgi:hypothetical protein